ncbi:MAG: polysaccharide deacetylase family protein [Bacteroidales bacterium]|nr:polysaccharide deacetylase family protein [Bacteroidales bacterium]
MTRKWILFCAVFLSLVAAGCKKVVQPNDQPETASEAVSEKSSTKEKQAGNTPARIYARPEVPILCYHRIADGKKGDYTVSPATFSAHMKILADSGYHSISPAQLYDYLVYNKNLPKKPVMITFDDSRIEHTEIAAPIMEKNGFRGVFFIMTITYGKKNYMTTEQIAQLAKAGHTVGLHTWDHTMVTKYKETTDWQKQIAAPKEKLEKIVGRQVEYFAYPNGVYDHKGAKELSKYFKISFILTSKRDSIEPLQTVRRMIAPEWTAQGLLKSMRRTFKTL